MAIKMKHEGSAASRLAAGADKGRAKRAMEAAAFAKGRDIQQKTAATAHASAPSISAAPVGHAQLIGAPGAAPLGHAPSAGGLGASVRFGGGYGGSGGGIAAPRTVATSGISGGGVASPFGLGKSVQTSTPKKPKITRFHSGSDLSGQQQNAQQAKPAERMKVTGSSIFSRPDDASVWDPETKQWKRPYLPGEYEAEAKERIGRVENDLYADRALTAQGQKERAALVNDITTAIRNGKFSKEEQAQLMKEYGIADENIRMADALRDRDPTPEEQFRKNTFTDANGVVFSPDGKMLYNPMDAEAKREDMRLRREEVTQARKDANEQKRIAQIQKFVSDLEKPITVTEMVEGAAEDQNGDKIPGPVKMTRFLSNEEKDAALQRYMSSLSQFGQPQGGEAEPQATAPQAQAATVPGFTPVSGQGDAPAPAPQVEVPTPQNYEPSNRERAANAGGNMAEVYEQYLEDNGGSPIEDSGSDDSGSDDSGSDDDE